MAAISQTTFWNAFSWKKMDEFHIRFNKNLFLMIQLATFQHWFRQCLGADQAMNQWWLVYWRIYVPLGLNVLIAVASYLPNFIKIYWKTLTKTWNLFHFGLHWNILQLYLAPIGWQTFIAHAQRWPRILMILSSRPVIKRIKNWDKSLQLHTLFLIVNSESITQHWDGYFECCLCTKHRKHLLVILL